jgi:hypothetical protein
VFVVQSTGGLSCGTTEALSTDPRCSTLTDVTGSSTSASGALASGIWQLAVIDEATGVGAAGCTVAGLSATCTIPPRQIDQPPHSFRLVTMLDNVTDLTPAARGPFGEYTVDGRTYTGVAPITVSKCTQRTIDYSNEIGQINCAYATYARVTALAAAELTFTDASVQVSTSVGPDVTVASVPYAPSPIVSSAMTWNAGPAVLPGS